tara:strand:- start:2407 stop:2613 length:207 start_codon:yes stop_codon:yes gene_type:complete
MYLEALLLKYKSDMASATANLMNYIDNSVGVAEHPDVITSLDALVEKIAEAEEKAKVIENLQDFQAER